MLTLQEVLSPSCDIWLPPRYSQTVVKFVPSATRRDIIEAYLLVKRCEKELFLLKQDMHNTLLYWKDREEHANTVLKQIVEDCRTTEKFKRGCMCLLGKHIVEVNLIRSKSALAFQAVVSSTADLPQCAFENVSYNHELSDSSDSEDYDSSDCEIDTDY